MKKEHRKTPPKSEHIDPERRMIRSLLRKPMQNRMNWLRKRLPNGGSSI